jgi:hypothetical protein
MLSPLLPDPAHPRVRWHQLHGSATGLLIAEAAAAAHAPLLVVASDTRELDRLRAELEFF